MENIESAEFDVLIIGAGPAGLATAIRLGQLAKQQQKQLNICVLEKGATVGAHIIGGAILQPESLEELIPNWRELNAPITTKVSSDHFWIMSKTNSYWFPTPKQMRNDGNFVISLSQVCRWLATQAESLGVQIFSGFAAQEPLYDKNNRMIGVVTGAQGIDKHGNKKPNYQPGMHLLAKYIVVAEGARGSLTKIISKKYNLRADCDPQTYGLGIKELWEVSADQHESGKVIHTVGWPLDNDTYGGSFIYHLDPNLIAIGFVVGLDYKNPYLSPFDELQRFKQHPKIRPMLENGRRIEYGAKVINEGGLQSVSKIIFPGGILVGCAAGFLNVPKIKGAHTAMKSGIIAAETIFPKLEATDAPIELQEYETAIKKSCIWSELYKVRNIRPAFQRGFWFGMAYAGFDTYILRGRAPWTFKNHEDHLQLKPAGECNPIKYPRHDGKISFDKMTDLQFSNVNHAEDQPPHLVLANKKIAIDINYKIYKSPEQRYCPAGVYEIVGLSHKEPYLQINAQNCLHCKACDIKDPTQNITWEPPEGAGGPNYTNM